MGLVDSAQRENERVAVLAAIVTALVLPGGSSTASSRRAASYWSAARPASLKAKRSRGSCARPQRSAHSTVPVVIHDRRSQWQAVRIAHVGASVTYGPVVMRYQDGSDTRPVSTYGPRSLWLYDVATERGSELLRFSSLTGRLEQTVPMPKLYRPVIAADGDGIYLT